MQMPNISRIVTTTTIYEAMRWTGEKLFSPDDDVFYDICAACTMHFYFEVSDDVLIHQTKPNFFFSL